MYFLLFHHKKCSPYLLGKNTPTKCQSVGHFKKLGQPRPLFILFLVFSNKHHKFLQQIYAKKCPSSIRYWDSNPRPSECESPPITTRPGLPPNQSTIFVAQNILARRDICQNVTACHYWLLGVPIDYFIISGSTVTPTTSEFRFYLTLTTLTNLC